MFPQNLLQKLSVRQENDVLRTLKIYPKNAIDFFSNDYLGLAKLHHECNKNIKAGATGSRLISGNSSEIEDLENQLSHFYDGETALLYHSGFDANLGFFSCVPQRNDLVIYDEYIHASIHDGMRLSYAKSLSFSHNNIDELEQIISKNQGKYQNIYVVLEGIYSMDGDAPHPEKIKTLKEKYPFYLIIDEAHSTGILGKNLKGWYENLGKEAFFARIHTFGKALGTHGACIVGSKTLKKYLVNYSRPFIYSTGPSFSQIHEIEHHHLSFDDMASERHLALSKNLNFFSKEMQIQKKLESPIFSYFCNEIRELEARLLNENLLVKAIFAPTVPIGKERLRISFHSFNTFDEISALCNILKSHK